MIRGIGLLIAGGGIAISTNSEGQYILKVTVGGGSFIFPWQTPNKELDPRVAVAKDTFVYVSAANPISTTGLIDLVIGGATLQKAPPGIWQAAKDVPAQVTVGGVVKYNVPQNPPPGAPAATWGTPLAGDFDGDAGDQIFWLPWTGGGSNCEDV